MDTAQPFGAAETDSVANAALAFKAFDNPAAVQPRDETGRFASDEPEEVVEEAEDEAPLDGAEAEVDEAEDDEDGEAEAVEAHPMPPSWGADDAALWDTLPPDAQAKIAAREGERDRGLNLKLQEAANVRKAAELAAAELQAKREDYARQVDMLESLYRTPEPDPRAFGYGTRQFNEAGYNAAVSQWRQNEQQIAQLTQQRDAVLKEADEAAQKQFSEWKQQHEAEYAPKLLADVPDLKDPAKAAPLINDLIQFATASGIPEDVFKDGDQITSAQLHILWMAHQFAKARSTPAKAKPKPANGPAVRPGVSSPVSAKKATARQRAYDRLAREGSVDAAAALFKHIL